MKTITTAILLAAAVGSPRLSAAVTVTGGGPTKSDCYAGFDVSSTNPGFTSDSKTASASACGGSCTFSVAACIGLTEPADCTAPTLRSFKSGTLAAPAGLGPANVCGAVTPVTVLTKRNGKKKGIKKFRMKARAESAKPKNDADNLKLICNPNPSETGCGTTATTSTTLPGGDGCATNPAGGPKELVLTIGQTGTDLDNGWTGSSHNFILVPNGKIDGCLTNCNSGSDTICDFNAVTGAGTPTGATFGAPLPLLASNVPVCVVSKWADNISGTADEKTGDISLNIHLTSEVYLTDVTSVCPQCKNNKCNSGQNSGKACTVDAPQIPVFISQGNVDRYDLSEDCPPSSPPAASLKIDFVPLTTGTAAPLQGPVPCNQKPGEPAGVQPPQPDACGGGGCGSACSGLACLSKIDDPVNPGTQVCIDSKGGVSQLCCNNNTQKPCFTLANGGTVNRAGNAVVPTPALPDTTYPKQTTTGVLASTFCIPSTGKSSIDQVTGLPGPGAIQLTGPAVWTK